MQVEIDSRHTGQKSARDAGKWHRHPQKKTWNPILIQAKLLVLNEKKTRLVKFHELKIYWHRNFLK